MSIFIKKLKNSTAIFRPLLIVPFAFALAASVSTGTLGCSDDDNETQKPLIGSRPGTERWLVYLKGEAAPMDAYRLEKDPSKKKEMAAELREGNKAARADFEKRLEEFDGKVVAHWWMTNAVTVEIPSGTDKSVLQIEGVKSMAADQPLK